jgi:2-isopropylmalate synthase
VLLESTGPAGSWTTVGVHSNVVEASWLALVDALAYAALRERGPVPLNS